MSASTLCAVMPVKSFARAKQRLMPLLDDRERAALARAMFEDVLHVLVSSPCVIGALVVTGDAEAAKIARQAGADVLPEPPEAGLIPAVRHASRALVAARRAGMLVVPADLPLIKPADLELIALGHRTWPAVTLVAASNDGGTNALACSPPDALPICFGDDSFRQHCNAALALGLTPKVLTLPRFGRDIDRPADLFAFVEQPSATRAWAYLVDSGIASRLRALRAYGQVPECTHARPADSIRGEAAAFYPMG